MNLDAALAYAARGWRVVPIQPGKKVPQLDAWTERATTDAGLITEWWRRWPNHGVGIVTGARSGIWVLDIDVGPGKNGDDTLDDLCATYGQLPATVEALTGTGGRHLYFRWPEGVEIRNDQAGRLGRGIDIRGEGGQVLAPPTVHPNGVRYEWESEGDPDVVGVADAPAWLLALLAGPSGDKQPRRERAPRVEGDTPGNRLAAEMTWPDLLEPDGATFLDSRRHHASGTTYELWSRPPMPGEQPFIPHTSASLGYMDSDVLKVFTPNWGGVDPETGEVWRLEVDQTYTKFGYYAARHHGGDYRAAARALARLYDMPVPDVVDELAEFATEHDDDVEAGEPHGWEPVDMALALAKGFDPPVPSVLSVGNHWLFYAGKVNGLYGESGAGKSWLSMMACVEAIKSGRGALFIDLEDHVSAVLDRMRALGCTDDELLERFVYVAPELRWSTQAASAIQAMIYRHDVAVAVIDSTGEAMALDGAKPNDDDDTARWFRRMPRWIARRGPAVLLLDHVPKDPESGRLKPIGSQRKRAAIDGSAFQVEVRQAPSRTTTGHLRLVCAKDRHGHFVHGKRAADVTIEPVDNSGQVAVRIAPPEVVKRPTVLMERVSKFLESQASPVSWNTVRSNVNGNAGALRQARDILAAEGFIELATGGLVSIRAFRDDPIAQATNTESAQETQPGPPGPRWDQGGTKPADGAPNQGGTTGTMGLSKRDPWVVPPEATSTPRRDQDHLVPTGDERDQETQDLLDEIL